MAKSATTPAPVENAGTAPPKHRRLTAEARKSSILAAARRAFTETGDMSGTTIKVIAARSGISEGVIYRHFESKDQLFFEAVVEPLKKAVDDLVAATELVDKDEPLTPQRQLETMTGLYRQLTSTLEGILPLLGLVLFGDPQVAKKFYREKGDDPRPGADVADDLIGNGVRADSCRSHKRTIFSNVRIKQASWEILALIGNRPAERPGGRRDREPVAATGIT
jgi:AcrR family transcriptional regulator